MKLCVWAMGVVAIVVASGAGCNAPPAGSPIKNSPRGDGQATLYQQLGGEPAVAAIAGQWIDTAVADPRVDFVRHGHPHAWAATPDNLGQLKTYFTQFLGMLSDGPQVYEGHNLQDVHTGMQISEGEWLAFMEDLKKTLDAMGFAGALKQDLMTRVAGTHDSIVNQ